MFKIIESKQFNYKYAFWSCIFMVLIAVVKDIFLNQQNIYISAIFIVLGGLVFGLFNQKEFTHLQKSKKIVFIVAPLRAVDKIGMILNRDLVLRYARELAKNGYIPFVPHLTSYYLDDFIPEEREIGIETSKYMLIYSDEVHLLGDKITEGMQGEIELAESLNKKIIKIPLF